MSDNECQNESVKENSSRLKDALKISEDVASIIAEKVLESNPDMQCTPGDIKLLIPFMSHAVAFFELMARTNRCSEETRVESHEIISELKSLTQDFVDCKTSYNDLKAKYDKLVEQNKTAVTDNERLRIEISDIGRKALTDNERLRGDISKLLADRSDYIFKHTKAAKDLHSQLDKATNEKEVLEASINQLTAENNSLIANCESWKRLYTSLNSNYESLNSARKVVDKKHETEIKALNTKLSERQSEILDLQNRLSVANESLEKNKKT